MRRIVLLYLISLISFSLMAERVENVTALNVAKTIAPDSELIDLSSNSIFNNFYIFSGDHSFVIISADDRATPVLAYSNEFPFVVENMPDNINYWLTSLNDEIQYAIDNNVVASDEIRSDWDNLKRGIKPEPKTRTSVDPLIATHWNQGAPYNNMCPGGSVTGCAATAMAQVMKYWEWPRQGSGSHSYYSNYGYLSVNFGNTVYDWDNMPDMPTSSSPQAQQDAVATLMYHCGVSIEMNYSPESSGAYPSDVIYALEDYFDYSNGIQSTSKNYYSNAEWRSLLKSELDADRPILYSGWDIYGGGHSFVCDGYDNNDNFHFNWGWGGYCDGYFAIGALNPGTGGTGSGSGHYNEDNYILLGVEPNTPSINPPSNVTADVNSNNVTISWSAAKSNNECDDAHHYKVYRDGFVINNNVTGTSFTDNDVAYGTHKYHVRSVKSNGDYSVMSDYAVAEVVYEGPIPTNLTAIQSGSNSVKLNWDSPASEDAVLKYGDGQSTNSVGYGTVTDFYWGQRYTSEQLSDYAGMAITSIQAYIGHNTSYTLLVYKETSGGGLQQIHTNTFNHNGGATWKTISLNTPLVIDYTCDILIVLHTSNIEYPAYVTDYSAGSPNASLYSANGVSFTNYDANKSWMFKTNISDGTYTYNVYRDGNQIASNVAQDEYNDQNLGYGTYEYTVRTNYYGGISNPSEPVSITVDVYEPVEYDVTVSANPNNAGSVSGGGTYDEGANVTVEAISNVGYIFENWKENGSIVSSDATYSFVINGNRNLVANFANNDLSVNVTNFEDPSCNGEDDGSVTIAAQGGMPPYIYKVGSMTHSTSNASYTFNNIGAGTYDVKVEDATGFEVETSVILTDPEGLTAGEINSGEEEICYGESATTITNVEDANTGQGNITYRWKRNGSVISNSNTSELTPTSLEIGTNTFTREVKDDCEDWTSSEGQWVVMVYDLPELEINGDTDIILGESTTLTASGAESYLWSTGETTASIIVSPTDNTVYSVIGTNNTDCTSEASVTVYVTIEDAIGENYNNVKVYPNPTYDKIYIECENIENIKIVSVTGQVVGYQDVNDDNAVIDMQPYPQSTYILLISKQDGTIIRERVSYYR